MDRLTATVDGTQLKDIEEFDVSIVRTFTDEIKRTVKGVVKTFPMNYITIGITMSVIMEVRAATDLVHRLMTKNTVIISCVNNKYDIGGTVSATDKPQMDRLKDKDDDLVRVSLSLVSVGVPVVNIATTGAGKIVMTLPAAD